eukprot:11205192-Lingulodinium_polyedra.AAC.1
MRPPPIARPGGRSGLPLRLRLLFRAPGTLKCAFPCIPPWQCARLPQFLLPSTPVEVRFAGLGGRRGLA